MPKKNRNTEAACNAGKNPEGGSPQRKIVRKSGSGAAPDPAIIGHSIYDLKLSPKAGTEVFFKREGISDEDVVVEDLYNDLWKAFRNAYRIFRGERLTVNPIRCLAPAYALEYILSELKKIIPKRFEYNIDYDDYKKEYYFTIYRECPWNFGWNTFPIRRVVEKLSRECPKLHELFLSFLQCFSRITDTELWTKGLMSNTLDMLEESLEYRREELNKEELVDLAKDIHTYTKGEAARYLELIKSRPSMEPEEIAKRVIRFKKAAPIVNLIYQGCEVAKVRNSIYRYTYLSSEDEVETCALDLDCQCTIIWDEDDSLTKDHEGSLDAYAQEGVREPVLFMSIRPGTKRIDLDDFMKAINWPQQLSDYMRRAYELVNEYVQHEPQN